MRGIYKIINKRTGMVYIGESMNIERRWGEHIKFLNENNHHSYKLQKAWNQEGGQDLFEFEVLEEIDHRIDDYVALYYLIILEDKYIKEYDSLENGYNCEMTLQKVLSGEKSITGNPQKDKRITETIIMKLDANMRLWKAEKAKIECIETGVIYENPDMAAQDYNINPTRIIKGKKIKGIIKVRLNRIKSSKDDYITFRYLDI